MKKLLKTTVIALIWIAVWFIAAAAVNSEILLPSPLLAARALIALLKTSDFYLSVVFSILRISCGFLLGAVLGVTLGSVTFFVSPLKAFFSPLMSVIKSTPVASFIVLLFVWFSNSTVAAITSTLIVLPVIWGAVFSALSGVDKNLIEMANTFSVSKKRIAKSIYIPSVMPYLKSAASTAMGLSWKAGVAAEVICNPKNSIGGGIYSSKVYLDTPSLFAWTFVVIIVSIILEKIIIKLMGMKRESAK